MRSVRASWHLHEGRLQVSSDTVPGRRRDYIEIYELDDRKRKPRSVDDDFICDVKAAKVRQTAEALRTATLPAVLTPRKSGSCDYRGMCTAG